MQKAWPVSLSQEENVVFPWGYKALPQLASITTPSDYLVKENYTKMILEWGKKRKTFEQQIISWWVEKEASNRKDKQQEELNIHTEAAHKSGFQSCTEQKGMAGFWMTGSKINWEKNIHSSSKKVWTADVPLHISKVKF